ncbi:MAG: hypothetical protein ACR2II_04000 [Chthoniobacterales bacterium]
MVIVWILPGHSSSARREAPLRNERSKFEAIPRRGAASNLRQAGWGYTTNSATSWTFPGVLENNVFRSDPVLDSDASVSFFYLSLLETFFDNMWRSLNGA